MPALVFRLLAGMVVLTGLGSSAAAAERSAEAAPTKTVHLTLISEGAACPQIGAQIQREIAAFSTQIVFLAHAETAAQAQRIQVRTQAQATTGYLADLLTEGETRRIDGTTCDALADAITLILLVAYDPETPIPSTQARAPFAKPAAAPTTASTAPVAPVAQAVQSPIKPIAKSPSPTQARAIEFYAGAEASASLTPFYDTTLGLGAVLGLEQQRGFDIRLGFAAGTTRVFGSASPAVFELATLALEACPLALRLAAQLDLYPCGGFALGAVRGQGRAAPIPNEALALWADARVGARMKLRLGRWSLVAGGGALLPLTRPTFVFEKPRIEVSTVPAIAAFFTIGVEKRFP